jgi:hypothetical protein
MSTGLTTSDKLRGGTFVAQTCVVCRSAAVRGTSVQYLNGKAADPREAGSALHIVNCGRNRAEAGKIVAEVEGSGSRAFVFQADVSQD